MVFVSQHTSSTFIFLKDKKKIKELQPSARTKTHAKKDGGKLNNIMNLIVFFSLAHTAEKAVCHPTEKKSYKGIMLNSQQRNVKKNNAQPTGSFNYFFCQSREEPTLPTAVCKHDLFLCCPLRFTSGLRQLCGFANLLFIFNLQTLKCFYKLETTRLQTAAAATSTFIL
jgi:hypothetical protein